MLLEVAALRHPSLHKHRNIVELIGYGVETDAWHESPFLVMELAVGDLGGFLPSQRSWEVLQQLCLDVGYGLDVIHHHGLVHGDLKPLNILIFPAEPVPYVAKLAEFGFSIGELDGRRGGSVKLSGCSNGWAAPEIKRHFENGTQVTVSELLAADNFAYGLLVLSSLCYGGKVVPYDALNSSQGIEKLISGLPDRLRETLRMAASSLLQVDYTLRPQQVGDFLKDDSKACAKWLQTYLDFDQDRTPSPKSRFDYAWQVPSLAPLFVEGIDNAFQNSKTDLTGPQLLVMCLYTSFRDVAKPDKSLQVQMFLESGRKGYPPARGVAQIVLRSSGLPISDYLSPEEVKLWLYSVVSTGCFSAYRELAAINPELARAVTDQFRDMSGYNPLFSTLSERESRSVLVLESSQDNSDIHEFAESGKLDALKSCLDLRPQEINARNAIG